MKKARGSQSHTGPRSLNISVRKKENDRIERENHAFAKRLFENKGSVAQVKALEAQFQQSRHMKDRVMRVKKTLPGLVLGVRNTALPPLEEKSELEAAGQKAVAENAMQNSGSKNFKSLN